MAGAERLCVFSNGVARSKRLGTTGLKLNPKGKANPAQESS